jgi:protein-disulfide isomerase
MRTRVWIVSVTLVIAWLVVPTPVSAQTPSNAELKKDIQALTEIIKAMQKDLQDLKTLVQQGRQPSEPPSVALDLGKNPFKGVATAKLTLVEFTDYQ